MKTWSCKIGETDQLPDTVVEHAVVHADGAVGVRHEHSSTDQVMRRAVEEAYRELTGDDPTFVFSGWGAQLDEGERAVVEDREPEYLRTMWLEAQLNALRIRLREGDPLPPWSWPQWISMVVIKLGHAAMFLGDDDVTGGSQDLAMKSLLAVAAAALDAIEALETAQGSTQA